MDNKMKNYERDVDGLLDIFGTVGGVQELLIDFIGSFYAFFGKKAFIGSMARKFFLVKNTPDL
jgi:hypothetical protein